VYAHFLSWSLVNITILFSEIGDQKDGGQTSHTGDDESKDIGETSHTGDDESSGHWQGFGTFREEKVFVVSVGRVTWFTYTSKNLNGSL
jgi:hypothetical protein